MSLASGLNVNVDLAMRVYDEYVTKSCVFCESGRVDPDALERVIELMPDAPLLRAATYSDTTYLGEALRSLDTP